MRQEHDSARFRVSIYYRVDLWVPERLTWDIGVLAFVGEAEASQWIEKFRDGGNPTVQHRIVRVTQEVLE